MIPHLFPMRREVQFVQQSQAGGGFFGSVPKNLEEELLEFQKYIREGGGECEIYPEKDGFSFSGWTNEVLILEGK